MAKGRIITEDADFREMLKNSKTIAVLGLSPKPERDSHRVALYLKNNGYGIIPVRPGQKEILGEKACASLDDVNAPVDILDVFRSADRIPDHVDGAIRLKPKVFWMQLGIENAEAAERLVEAGIDVVMNKCIKIEHARLLK